jgi:hypothetical protein
MILQNLFRVLVALFMSSSLIANLPLSSGAVQRIQRGCVVRPTSVLEARRVELLFSYAGLATGYPDIDKEIATELEELFNRFSVRTKFYPISRQIDSESGTYVLATSQVAKAEDRFEGRILFDLRSMWEAARYEAYTIREALPAIMAHEFAHIVQLKQKNTLRLKFTELQADCLAGWYVSHKVRYQSELRSIKEAYRSFLDSDYFASRYRSYIVGNGTPQDRIRAFDQGCLIQTSIISSAYISSLRYVSQFDEDKPPPVAPKPAHTETPPVQTRPKPEVIAEDLKAVAKRTLESSTTRVISSVHLNISAAAKKVFYNIGRVRGNLVDFSTSDPYALPFETQLHIEAVRSVFAKAAPNETFWVSPLRNAEMLVKKTIQDIESTEDMDTLPAILNKRNIDIDREFENLKTSIADYATNRGFKAVRVADTDAPEKLEVAIIIEPTGGRVRLIASAEYDLHKNILGESKDKWPWRDILESRAKLLGAYHYLVQWPAGQCDEGDITIDSKFSRTFRPGKCD